MSASIAFFDMDYTILDASSSLLYVKYLRQRGQLKRRQLLRVGWWAILYKLSAMDLVAIMPRILSYANTISASETFEQAQVWFKDMVAAHIAPQAVQHIREHQHNGQRVAIISASSQFAVQPVAQALDLDFLCTQLEVKDDQLTGQVVEPVCFGSGKIFWAKQYAEQHAAQLSDCYLYTDSYTDRPLLEIVGHPIAVNPDPRLKRLARRRHWPIVNFY